MLEIPQNIAASAENKKFRCFANMMRRRMKYKYQGHGGPNQSCCERLLVSRTMKKASDIFRSAQCVDQIGSIDVNVQQGGKTKINRQSRPITPVQERMLGLKSVITSQRGLLSLSLCKIGEHAEENSKYPPSSPRHDDHLSSGHYLDQLT